MVEPQFISGEINEFDAYLLCSDGLWHRVEENEMQQEVLTSNCAAEHLIQNARSKNEKDNVSVITIVEENKESLNARLSIKKICLSLVVIIVVIIVICIILT